jgi:predicted amino acid racemase
VSTPRLEVNLGAITHNTRTLVDRLSPLGIGVTGVSKATLGSPAVASAMLSGGASRIGDSRIGNLTTLRAAGVTPLTLIRTPMLSQVADVVRLCDTSLNTEPVVLDALAGAALALGTIHDVVLMVELGDLREGVAADDVVALARHVRHRPGLRLVGLGTNLACRCGVIPDQAKMEQLSHLAMKVEAACHTSLRVVSGGNSANLDWALNTTDTGRINDLRLGEAILLGTEPSYRRPIEGLRLDAFTLVAEVIEARLKPAQPWGKVAQATFGHEPPPSGTGTVRQAIVALGRQDTDPEGTGARGPFPMLGMSSDHLLLDVGEQDVSVGDEIAFDLDYSALVRAMTSPFVTTVQVAEFMEVGPSPQPTFVAAPHPRPAASSPRTSSVACPSR